MPYGESEFLLQI